MKYLKTFPIFESSVQDWITDIFNLLNYEGFTIDVKESQSVKIDFSQSDIISSTNLSYNHSDLVKTIDVEIKSKGGRRFLIDEIKDTLLSAQSYIDTNNIDINYIYLNKSPSYTYYKSVEYLPFDSNWWINSVVVSFKRV